MVNFKLKLISKNLFPALAFTIPLIVRLIPEILMGPFTTGFDTMSYYVPNTIIWLQEGVDLWFLSIAPFIYILLMGITSTGTSVVIALKVMSPLLLGLLGLTVFFYANKALLWSPKKSIIAVLFSTLYFVALRVSWDMLRTEIGLIFLFLMLTLLNKKPLSLRSGAWISLVMALIVITNQLIAVIMFVVIIAAILRLFLDKKKLELKKIVLLSVPAVSLFLAIFYIDFFTYSLPAEGGILSKYSGGFEAFVGFSQGDWFLNLFGFLAFCYLPLVPFLIFGIKQFLKNTQLKAWVFWIIISLILFIINPILSFGILPYRWILLLTYPLAFCAAEGFSVMKGNLGTLYKIGVATILVMLSLSFMVLPNNVSISYYGAFPTYFPKSMLQNTVQLSDCQDTTNALLWARNNMPTNSQLLVHDVFYGWSALIFESDQLIPYSFDNPEHIAKEVKKDSALYLIWWVNGSGWYGQPTVDSSFTEIYNSGQIAIYKYID